MKSLETAGRGVRRWFVTALASVTLLLLVSSAGLAQMTPTPAVMPTPAPGATVTPTVTPTPALTAKVSETEEARRNKLVGSYWYYSLVTVMFLAVLVPFVLAIYRGTSGSRATDNRPLGLPVGSFRSILAYSLVAYLGFYVLTSVLSISLFQPPEFLLGIVATVIGFYFGSRSGDEGEANLNSGTVRGVVRLGTNPARGAVIRFKRSDDGTEMYSRISDLFGRFELRGVKPGAYKVKASFADSSVSDEKEISVIEGSDHEIELIIKGAGKVSPGAV